MMSFTQQDRDVFIDDAVASFLSQLADVWAVAGLNPESEIDVLEIEIKNVVDRAHTRLVARIDEQVARLKRRSRR